MNKNNINIRLFSTGYCTANNKHIHKNEKSYKVKCHAIFALIEHYKLGKILYDTGYSNSFYEETKKMPYFLYKLATPVYHKDENSCINQLKNIGLTSKDISYIIISHFHADHISGLKDFIDNTILCSGIGLNDFQSKNSLSGVLKGYIKPLAPKSLNYLFPENFLTKTKFGNFDSWQWEENVFFIDLSGHCKGQLGLFLKNTNLGDVFFVADSVWSSKAFREKIYPSKITSIFVDDLKKSYDCLSKINQFYIENPNVLIIPSHCNEIVNKYIFK